MAQTKIMGSRASLEYRKFINGIERDDQILQAAFSLKAESIRELKLPFGLEAVVGLFEKRDKDPNG